MPANSLRFVTDTTACLPPGFADAHSVAVVPQVVRFGEQVYLEGVDISYADYVQRLKTSGEQAFTAGPPPGEFIKAYTRQLAGASTVISLHPSNDISGTVRSAVTARSEEFAGADIRILDTRTVAGNLGTLVQQAVAWADAGRGADEIVTGLEALFPRGRTYFLVATLEYLQRGGRIGGAQALIGGMLQIKPLLELRAGRVEPLERVRTYNRAYERLKELVLAGCPRTAEPRLCVMHADNQPEADRLAGDLRSAMSLTDIPVFSVSAAITTHAGPGTIGAAFFEAG